MPTNPIGSLHSSVLTAPVRTRLRQWVIGVLQKGEGSSSINFDEPHGDPGLFGPDSVTWRIHADFPGMMSGGICALMLQTLHPLALSGVWDHSSFRDDVLGRLRRTTGFVAGTTYAPRAEALKLIAKVKKIHGFVRGTAPDGRAYSADDPALLTWVHTTEMQSFLNGYQRYRDVELPLSIQDRYYAETSLIAERLGARNVPKSAAAVNAYFERVQGELEFGERSVAVLDVLNQIRLPIPVSGVSRELFLGAGAALLPPWALQKMQRSRVRQLRDRAAARGLRAVAPLLRAALRDGIGAHSCRRVGLDPALLHSLPLES